MQRGQGYENGLWNFNRPSATFWVMTIAVDFDGTIYAPSQQDSLYRLYGRPQDGARECLRDLIERGFRVVLHTCRAANYEGTLAMLEWLQQNDFPRMEVANMKPQAALYVDDKACRFTGRWQDVLDFIREHLDGR